MKIKLTLIIFYLINTIQAEEEKTTDSKKTMTLQQVTVFAQEILYAQFVLPNWLNPQKAFDSIVYCNICDRPLSSIEFYGQLIGQGNADSIAKLKDLWFSGTVQDLELFLKEIANKTSMGCATCLTFNGWHCQTNIPQPNDLQP